MNDSISLKHSLLSQNGTTFDVFESIFYRLTVYSLFPMLLCFLIIFPFYVYLNKVNRERDVMMSLYPITNEFFEMIKKIYFLLFLLIVDVLLMIGSNAIDITLIGTISRTCTIPIFVCLHIATQIIQLLISLVAIRKFLMHFFPSLIPKILKAQTILINKIWIFYILLFINDAVGLIHHIISSGDSNFSYLLISMNGVLVMSSLLYFPLLISLWCKKKEVEDRKKNKPQTLIIWQTVIILVFKVTSITMIILSFTDHIGIFTVVIISDIISTPLIVQISYFFNNRKSVKFMIWNFSLAKFIKVLLNWETKSAVEPERTSLEMNNV